MKTPLLERSKGQLFLPTIILVLIITLIFFSAGSSLLSDQVHGGTSLHGSPVYSPLSRQYSNSVVAGNVTNLSSQLSSLLIWAAADGVVDDQLVITGGDGCLVSTSLSNSVSLYSISGISGYTQFVLPLDSNLLIGGNNPGAQFYQYAAGASSVQSYDSAFPVNWTGLGSDLLISLSYGGNYTFVVEEDNGTSTGTAPPQIGLLHGGTFQNITSAFPHIPAVGAGFFSVYGGGDFLLMTSGFSYLYNVSTSYVSNISSILHVHFSSSLGQWVPSAAIWDNGQFLIAYSGNLTAFNSSTGVTKTEFTASSGSFLSFVSDIGNYVFVGEDNGQFTEIFVSIDGSSFVPLSDLWGNITDIASFGNSYWAVGRNEEAVLYEIPPLTLTIKVIPSSDTIGVGQFSNFSAVSVLSQWPYNPDNFLTPTYSWSLSNDLGFLNSSSGSYVSFTAGSTIGNVTLFVSATYYGITAESSPVGIQIEHSVAVLESVAIFPPSLNTTMGEHSIMAAVPHFNGSPGPNGTTFSWSTSRDLGSLNTSTGASIEFTAYVPGSTTITVKATLNGKTVYSSPGKITISSPLPDPNARGIQYLQYTNLNPEIPLSFGLVPQGGDVGVSFGVMGGTVNFRLTQGGVVVCTVNVTGGPINYNVLMASKGFAYTDFPGNGANLELTATSESSSSVVVAYNEYSGYISNWTASMITYPPQWGISFISADSPAYNTGMSFTVVAPTDNSVWMASSINEGYGNTWSSQVGFNRDVGNNTVSYAGWGVDFQGVSHGGQDPDIPLTPGVPYNFTMELLYGTTWGFFVNGIPINDTGIGYKWNMTTTTAQPGVVGIETSSVHGPSLNLTDPVVMSVATSFKSNGKWQVSKEEYLSSGVAEDWYNGNYSEVPSMNLWNIAGHLENSSIPNGTIVIGQSQSLIYAPPSLGYEPIFGNFTLSPGNQGQGVLEASWTGDNVTLTAASPDDIASIYSLPNSDKVTNIYNTPLTASVSVHQSQDTATAVVYGTISTGAASREIVLTRSQAGSLYNVTFSEAGLYSGSTWSITSSGSPSFKSASDLAATSTYSVVLANGSYAFSVSSLIGNAQLAEYSSSYCYPSQFNVDGHSQTVSITFTPLFNVRFSETGLLSGSYWYVNSTGYQSFSSSGRLPGSQASYSLNLPNGTYPFAIRCGVGSASIPGYTESSYNSPLVVRGGNQSMNVSFGLSNSSLYGISFIETGLAEGSVWYVALNGTMENSTSSEITFMEPNGTYSFQILPPPGATASPTSGTIFVAGTNVNNTIHFTATGLKLYNVTFVAEDLVSGILWNVTIDGNSSSSYSSEIRFQELNGTYSYSVTPIDGYNVSHQYGTITVNGSAVVVSVDFTQTGGNGYFVGSVTPSDVSIAIFVNGSWQSYKETGGSFNISLDPGTYRVSMSSPGHVTYSFNLTIYPSKVTYTTITTLPSSSTFPLGEAELIIAVIVVTAAITTPIILRRRKR